MKASSKWSFRGSLAAVVLLAVAAVPRPATAEAQAACPAGVFETDPGKVKESFKTQPRDAPLRIRPDDADPTPEITRIKDGAVENYIGAFINGGMETWWAYDAERHVFMRIEGMDGGSPTMIGEMARETRAHPHKKKHEVLRSWREWTFVLTTVPATPEQARTFACLANEALGWRPQPAEPVSRPAPASDADPLPAKTDPHSPAQVTVIASRIKPCDGYQTDTFSHTFDMLKDGRPQAVPLPAGSCDCACGAHIGELNGRVSGLIGQAMNEADPRSR